MVYNRNLKPDGTEDHYGNRERDKDNNGNITSGFGNPQSRCGFPDGLYFYHTPLGFPNCANYKGTKEQRMAEFQKRGYGSEIPKAWEEWYSKGSKMSVFGMAEFDPNAPEPKPEPKPKPTYDFTIESDGKVRVIRLAGSKAGEETRLEPQMAQINIDAGLVRAITQEESKRVSKPDSVFSSFESPVPLGESITNIIPSIAEVYAESIIIDPEVQAILTKFDNNDYTYPSWFNNNIEFVKNGSITSETFLAAFNNLLQSGTIIDNTISEIYVASPTVPESASIGFTGITSNSALVYWRPNKDGGSPIINYNLTVKNQDNNQTIIQRTLTNTELKIENLDSETNYKAYVIVINAIGNSFEQSYGFKTLAVPEVTPSIVTAPTITTAPTIPTQDSSINTMMISQSIGSFILKDGRLKGEILYIANTAFNPFYYGKNLASLVQIKSKSGISIAVKPNVLNFTNTERDERIQIDESVGNFKELIVDFYVWKSTTDLRQFSENKQIQVIETNGDGTECQIGFHKDFSGKCVPDDPIGEIPRDKLMDTLKGFLFGTVALSLLARKY